MTSLRRFRCEDMFRFGNINMDVLTETYHVGFYMSYLARWPECFSVAFDGGARLMGYIMGKAEGTGELWHGHVIRHRVHQRPAGCPHGHPRRRRLPLKSLHLPRRLS